MLYAPIPSGRAASVAKIVQEQLQEIEQTVQALSQSHAESALQDEALNPIARPVIHRNSAILNSKSSEASMHHGWLNICIALDFCIFFS